MMGHVSNVNMSTTKKTAQKWNGIDSINIFGEGSLN